MVMLNRVSFDNELDESAVIKECLITALKEST